MDNINKTLYIPLYGKALVSRKGIILKDEKAEAIWDDVKFPLNGKSRSKWLAYYMGMRAKVFDDWLIRKMHEHQDAVVLHLGCGLDSRCLRVGAQGQEWYDIDFPQVIDERQKHYESTAHYHMIGSDVTDPALFSQIPSAGTALIVMEGISMYLSPADLMAVLKRLTGHFQSVHLLMDCYTEFAAKASKYKNPINDVGVTAVYGLDDPAALAAITGLSFIQSHEMTPPHLISRLNKAEQRIFRTLYGGSIANKLYRLYEFQSG